MRYYDSMQRDPHVGRAIPHIRIEAEQPIAILLRKGRIQERVIQPDA